jgi:hypothetical protein
MMTLVQEMNISIANPVRIIVSKGLRYNLMLWGEVTHVGGKQEEAGLDQGEPPGGVEQGGLASQLTWLQPFGLFCVWRFSVIGQCKVSQKFQVLIQKMRALMGSLDWDTVAKAC